MIKNTDDLRELICPRKDDKFKIWVLGDTRFNAKTIEAIEKLCAPVLGNYGGIDFQGTDVTDFKHEGSFIRDIIHNASSEDQALRRVDFVFIDSRLHTCEMLRKLLIDFATVTGLDLGRIVLCSLLTKSAKKKSAGK